MTPQGLLALAQGDDHRRDTAAASRSLEDVRADARAAAELEACNGEAAPLAAQYRTGEFCWSANFGNSLA